MTAVALGTGGSPLWFATRATGAVALVLLTLTVALGIAGAGRLAAPGAPRIITAGLHRNLSLLVVALVAVHVLTTVADGYVPVSLASTVIPFSSPYRRLWLGLGSVALDLLLAVGVTSAHGQHP
jgi:sulfoxide reductase heme-binding subunit YedZ